jgi:hypothetical protein
MAGAASQMAPAV